MTEQTSAAVLLWAAPCRADEWMMAVTAQVTVKVLLFLFIFFKVSLISLFVCFSPFFTRLSVMWEIDCSAIWCEGITQRVQNRHHLYPPHNVSRLELTHISHISSMLHSIDLILEHILQSYDTRLNPYMKWGLLSILIVAKRSMSCNVTVRFRYGSWVWHINHGWKEKLHQNYLQHQSDDIFMWCRESSGRRSHVHFPHRDVRGKTHAHALCTEGFRCTADSCRVLWTARVAFSSIICHTCRKVWCRCLHSFLQGIPLFCAVHNMCSGRWEGPACVSVCILVSVTMQGDDTAV